MNMAGLEAEIQGRRIVRVRNLKNASWKMQVEVRGCNILQKYYLSTIKYTW